MNNIINFIEYFKTYFVSSYIEVKYFYSNLNQNEFKNVTKYYFNNNFELDKSNLGITSPNDYISIRYFKRFNGIFKLHRDNLPAYITLYGDGSKSIIYYNKGKIERNESYLPTNLYYRSNGKLYIEEYYFNNKLHRLVGPAFTYINEENIKTEDFYIFGKNIRRRDYYKFLKFCILLKIKIRKYKSIKRRTLLNKLLTTDLSSYGKEVCNEITNFIY